MKYAKKGFHYVVGRVDISDLPGLVRAKLWADFSQQPEGPGGSALLKLLYGLQDKPLPPEVVKFAAKADQEMYAGLFNMSACRNAGDARRSRSAGGHQK
jgi:hypothetical protein